MAKGVLKPQLDALDAELVVLAEPFLAREESPSLDVLAEALEALAGGPRLAVWFMFGDARPLLEQGLDELPVEGIGVDFYATHLADVPEGFSKLLLAGVVDVRSSLLEEPRELASFAQRLGERAERIALVPNGDLQYVSAQIAREKLARLGAAKTATRRPPHDRRAFLTHEIGSLGKPPWLVKTSQGRRSTTSDIEHARSWGEKVGVEGYEELVEFLRSGQRRPDESPAGRAATACGCRSRQGSRSSGTASSCAARCTPGRSSTRPASSRAAPPAASTTSTTPSRPRSGPSGCASRTTTRSSRS